MAVISKDLGAVTAYAAAVNRGYTGTKEEFETLMASYATVAQQAAESAGNASQSAQSASQSATDAETAKGTAQQAATDAQTALASAQESAQSAQQSAQSASQSAQDAESAKNTAVDAVDGFAAGAQQALDSVNQAGINWKSLAEAQKLDSEAWAVGQRDGEEVGSSDPSYHNNAKYYAESVGSSAQTATEAAQTATVKAQEAQASASAAAESAAVADKVFIIDTTSGAMASFPDGADEIPVELCVVTVEPTQEGSGNPSPTNIRNISGWTGVNVIRKGKNLIPNIIHQQSTTVINLGQTEHNRITTLFLKAGIYTITVDCQATANIYVRYGTNTSDTNIGSCLAPRTFTADKDGLYGFCLYNDNGINAENVKSVQLEAGNAGTDYELYNSTVYSITFPAEAGTVYSGHVDVTNGELVVDKKTATVSGVRDNGIVSGTQLFFATFEDKKAGVSNFISNRFFIGNGAYQAIGRVASKIIEFRIPLADLGVTDSDTTQVRMAAVENWLTENLTQVCYELETPVTYPLAPTEIKSLFGNNNIYADTGDIILSYRADTALYIDKRIGANAVMVADSNIVNGQYFMVGNGLYKATANIASGAPVVVGTNAEAKTMAEALNEINA